MTKTTLLATAVTSIALGAASMQARAETFTTVVTFPSGAGSPSGPLVVDGTTLYGVTPFGGDLGTLFKVDTTSKTYTLLYSYQDAYNVPFEPSYVIRRNSTLYIASSGLSHEMNGRYGDGYVTSYNVITGKMQTIHAFRTDEGSDAVGLLSYNGLLYGICQAGGGVGDGTVFSVMPKVQSPQTTVASLNGAGDGAKPAQLVQVGGQLYGIAQSGGASNDGTIFSVDPTSGKVTVVHTFGSGNDGGLPTGLSAANGVLYGTTAAGGDANEGTVFSFDTASSTYKVLYQFQGGNDGTEPLGGVLYQNGALYGTTEYGVNNGQNLTPGTVFKLNAKTGAYTLVYTFTGNGDGGAPMSPLVASHGVIYGATSQGVFGPTTIFTVTH